MADVACKRAWKEEGWGPYHKRLLTMCVSLENSGWKKMTGKTQNQLIIDHIKKAGSISRREAFLDYSIQCLTARISELRDAGYKIVGRTRLHPVTKQRYTRYYLAA